MRPRVWKPWKRILISRNTMGIIVTGKKPESNLHPLKKTRGSPAVRLARSASPQLTVAAGDSM